MNGSLHFVAVSSTFSQLSYLFSASLLPCSFESIRAVNLHATPREEIHVELPSVFTLFSLFGYSEIHQSWLNPETYKPDTNSKQETKDADEDVKLGTVLSGLGILLTFLNYFFTLQEVARRS